MAGGGSSYNSRPLRKIAEATKQSRVETVGSSDEE
jgi:hypothetical protein